MEELPTLSLSALCWQGLSMLRHGAETQGVGLRQPDMVRRELLIATSTFFTCRLLLGTGAQHSAAGNTMACVEIRIVLAEAIQVVPATRRMSETRCNLSCHVFNVLLEVHHSV